jgi:phosphatidylserine/phosphatidylglycerophosphate/cardiolipin synthase-like enzyme
MRFKSEKQGAYQVFAVSGTNTISFAIAADPAKTKGLLGFAVERSDPAKKKNLYASGFKVFPSIVPKPDADTEVNTSLHPVQSFIWDDFTAEPDHKYEYFFHPLKGTPENLDRTARPVAIRVWTEPLFSTLEHDVFFNRGVASSQAYTREFGNKRPDELRGAESAKAREWLSRQLDDAILKFISDAVRDDTLLCCFYEFRYEPVARALKQALSRGVNVRLIVDAKKNATKDHGRSMSAFPRTENLAMIERVGLPRDRVLLREARTNAIQHNNFMVRLKGKRQTPAEVWTGSTNISDGSIHGQTNVGHWVRDAGTAAKFRAYWDLLRFDPGSRDRDDHATANIRNKEFRAAVEAILAVPTAWSEVGKGITPIFSPRSDTGVLDMYARMVDEASDTSCITLAVGMNKAFKDLLRDNKPDGPIGFFLHDKEGRPRAKDPFDRLAAKSNIYEAFVSSTDEPLYQWARETNARTLWLNSLVSYIHSKFLLKDPLGTDPIVVTGSADFSDASTTHNDENMLVIRGNQRVADIYFTEFNRIFHHCSFHSVPERTRKMPGARDKQKPDQKSLFLDETDGWLAAYKPGSLERKRVDMFKRMKGIARPWTGPSFKPAGGPTLSSPRPALRARPAPRSSMNAGPARAGSMKLIDVLEVSGGSQVIQLLEGDLSRIPREHAVDVLIVSAFPDNFVPVSGTLIGALHEQGVSVAALAKKPEADLTRDFSCWLSRPVRRSGKQLNFDRILCFEPLRAGSPPEVVGDIFRALAPFSFGEPHVRSVAMPIVATGNQGYTISEILAPLLDAAFNWLSQGFPVEMVKIVVHDRAAVKEAKSLFARKAAELEKSSARSLGRRSHRPVPDSPAPLPPPPPPPPPPGRRRGPGPAGTGRPPPKTEQASGYDVFLSYSRKDQTAADRFAEKLTRAKVRVFQDKLSIEPGAAWQQQIFDALKDCARVATLYSPDFLASKVCQEEFNIAWIRQRKEERTVFFPLMLADCQLPPHMELLDYEDCRVRDKRKIEAAAARLAHDLKQG